MRDTPIHIRRPLSEVIKMDLSTTNVILGIMAAVSVLEALVVIGIAVAGFVIYRRVMGLVNDVEQRHIAPAMARVNGILDDVKHVSTKLKDETDRVDRAIHHTVDRVDDTAERLRNNIRAKTARIVGIVRGARSVIESILHTRESRAA
jgi:hypothetical protein